MIRNHSNNEVRKGERDLTGMENCQHGVRLEMPALERFLHRMNQVLGLKVESTFLRFVTDAEMLRLNRTFRKKAKTTDVLSFPTEERDLPSSLARRVKSLRGRFLGDIAISPKAARRNARLLGRTLEEEICVLMLHGTLHLLGYDHENDHGEMERVEVKLRRRLRLA